MLPPPRDLDPGRDALFLDFDGTLVDIAPTPDAVRPADHLPSLLQALQQGFAGAVAVISGRPVEQIDRFLQPLRLSIAGLHGRDQRLPTGERRRFAVAAEFISAARARLLALAQRFPGTLFEDKGETVALHYRNAPEAGKAALDEARRIEADSAGSLALIPGKMVVELVPAGYDKGRAVAHLLEQPPFAGRRPVFVGDDVTDEAGFEAVNGRGGLSVRIGPAGPTAAQAQLNDVPSLHAWLARALPTATNLEVSAPCPALSSASSATATSTP